MPADEPRIYFAKAFVYPLAAAPFVRLFGTRGLLLANALFLGLALVLGYAELRRRATPGRAPWPSRWSSSWRTVTPLYLFWPQPEVFNLAPDHGGPGRLAAGPAAAGGRAARHRHLLEAVQPWLALPLGRRAAARWRRRGSAGGLLESVRRGAVLAGTVIALFGLNRVGHRAR